MKDKNQQFNFDDLELAEGFNKLRRFLDEVETNDETIEELAADYASLFLGIGKHSAHPYESTYLSKDKIVMQSPWRQVLSTYQKQGLGKASGVKEPEDHIGLELEFMFHLCQRMNKALNRNSIRQALFILDAQEDFLLNHLGAWTADFCDDILRGSTRFDFYGAIALITKRFVALEKEHIDTYRKRFKPKLIQESNAKRT